MTNEPQIISEDVCLLCAEPITRWDNETSIHRECSLREVIGGIGHLIAHDYWCIQRGDPNAGLSYRQSALLCDAFVAVMGVEAAANRV